MDAKNIDDDVKNTYVDNVELNRDHPMINNYEFAKEANLCETLDIPGEIIYAQVSSGRYEMKFYTYSNCFHQFLVQGFVYKELFEKVHRDNIDKDNYSSDDEIERQKGVEKTERRTNPIILST